MRNLFPRTLQTTIIFLVVGGIMALALGGYFSSASNVFTGSLVNMQAWFSARFMAVQDFFTSPRDIASSRQRNAELESEVAELQAQVIQLQQQVGETQILAALLDFERSNPENTYRPAAVIGRDPSPFLHYVIINRGSNDGFLRGMPVVTNQGLIGRIDAVIADAARVQLITDDLVQALTVVDHQFGFANVFGFGYARRRVRLLASHGQIERLIAWYSR